jgi:hypothetical protein
MPPMTEMGQSRSFDHVNVTSAFPLIATESQTSTHVGDGPKGDIDGLHVVAPAGPCGRRSLQWRGHLSGPATEDVHGKQNGKGDPDSNVHVADPSAQRIRSGVIEAEGSCD